MIRKMKALYIALRDIRLHFKMANELKAKDN